jgi:hypothetical protein
MNLTAKKKLRSSIPVWIAYPAPHTFRQATEAKLEDGCPGRWGGISGALIAYALARDGYRVALVDCRGPLMGSTRRAPPLGWNWRARTVQDEG